MDAHDQSLIPWCKISVFVKDSVVRQMALGIARFHRATRDNSNLVLWLSGAISCYYLIEVSDDGNDAGINLGSKLCQRRTAGLLEGWAQR